MNNEITLIKIPFVLTHSLLAGLKNNLGVDAFLLGVSSKDTEFTYSIRSNKKINKNSLLLAKCYCDGYVNGITSIQK